MTGFPKSATHRFTLYGAAILLVGDSLTIADIATARIVRRVRGGGKCDPWEDSAGRIRKDFFFEKKKQKTFANCVRHLGQPEGTEDGRNRQKFFGSFFQKRTAFLTFLVEIFR